MQNPFPVYHSPRNNYQLFNICYLTCVTINKTYQFVLLSGAIDVAGLGLGLALFGLGLTKFWSH